MRTEVMQPKQLIDKKREASTWESFNKDVDGKRKPYGHKPLFHPDFGPYLFWMVTGQGKHHFEWSPEQYYGERVPYSEIIPWLQKLFCEDGDPLTFNPYLFIRQVLDEQAAEWKYDSPILSEIREWLNERAKSAKKLAKRFEPLVYCVTTSTKVREEMSAHDYQTARHQRWAEAEAHDSRMIAKYHALGKDVNDISTWVEWHNITTWGTKQRYAQPDYPKPYSHRYFQRFLRLIHECEFSNLKSNLNDEFLRELDVVDKDYVEGLLLEAGVTLGLAVNGTLVAIGSFGETMWAPSEGKHPVCSEISELDSIPSDSIFRGGENFRQRAALVREWLQERIGNRVSFQNDIPTSSLDSSAQPEWEKRPSDKTVSISPFLPDGKFTIAHADLVAREVGLINDDGDYIGQPGKKAARLCGFYWQLKQKGKVRGTLEELRDYFALKYLKHGLTTKPSMEPKTAIDMADDTQEVLKRLF